MNENLNLVESLKDCQEGTKIFMTKQEYLNSLPFHRKAELYIQYLEYNKYYDDLEPFYERPIEDAFNKDMFNSNEIADMIDCHSTCLSKEEWEIYNELETA